MATAVTRARVSRGGRTSRHDAGVVFFCSSAGTKTHFPENAIEFLFFRRRAAAVLSSVISFWLRLRLLSAPTSMRTYAKTGDSRSGARGTSP